MRQVLIWAVLAIAVLGPIAVAATSPLLAWRDPIYIAAGFAGIIALAAVLVQPVLAGRYLPALSAVQSRRAHRINGALLVGFITLHIAGLWITSPPDVIDALTFSSPTPFSYWGVVAMWAVFASAITAMLWRRRYLNPRVWRVAHAILAAIIVVSSVAHAVLVEGTMGLLSKIMLCVLIVAATTPVIVDVLKKNIPTR